MEIKQMAFLAFVAFLVVSFFIITIYGITTGGFYVETKLAPSTAAQVLSYYILTEQEAFAFSKYTFERYYNLRTFYGILDIKKIFRVSGIVCNMSNKTEFPCNESIFKIFSPDYLGYEIEFYNLSNVVENYSKGVEFSNPIAIVSWKPCDISDENYTTGFPVTVTDGINYDVWAVVIKTWKCAP